MHEIEERNQTDLGAIRSKAKSGKMREIVVGGMRYQTRIGRMK